MGRGLPDLSGDGVNYDLILGIWLGVCVALVVGAKLVAWSVVRFLTWLARCAERAL